MGYEEEIKKPRIEINKLNEEIVEKITQRVEVAKEVVKIKNKYGKSIFDKSREEKVLEQVKDLAIKYKISPENIERIFKEIIALCKKVEEDIEGKRLKVAFQGEKGAYSEEAIFQFFGNSVETLPCKDLKETFKSVEERKADFAMVPVENSLEGSITQTYDLLLDSKLKVWGEINLKIIHCLIANPETKLKNVKRVYSHPQALGQCKYFLEKLKCELIPTYDTAGSVKMIKENKLLDSAAIASSRAAKIYGMKILLEGIEDNSNNFTRFFVLSQKDYEPTGKDKTSIIFSLKHKPGTLFSALKVFADKKINLTKIESRPTRQNPWEYNFYLDFEGHREDKICKEALEKLEEYAIFVKILGSYPKAK